MYELKKYLNEIFANNKNITITARKANDALDGLVEATDDELKEIYDEYITYITTNSPNDKNNALGGSNFNLVVILLRYQIAFIEIEIKTPTKTFIVTSWGEIIDLDNQNPDEMTYRDAIRIFDFGGAENEIAIYKYKGTEKTLKFPKTIAGETVTTLGGGKKDGSTYSVIGTGYFEISLDEIAWDEENDEGIEFKEENFEIIKQTLVEANVNGAGDCNNLDDLKEILCAYDINGHWYAIGKETSEGVNFINKSENHGVTKVIIPDNITTIKSYALGEDPWLTSVYISATTIQGIESNGLSYDVFEGSNQSLKIYVTTPTGWGESDKENAETEFFYDDGGGRYEDHIYEIIWSDEPGYVAP